MRAVNIEPNFLVDKAAYLLGADQKTKASRLPECYKSFISLVQTVLGGIDDEGAKAVLKFYQSWKPTKAPEKLRYWDDITSDKAGFIAFQLCGERQYIHLRPKVRNAWQKYLSSQKSKLQGQCLLSGCQHTDLQQLHAQFKGIAGGQSSGKSLVSFNIKSAESYRKEQSFNAPVSIEAEFKSSTALKYLIRNDAQHLYIGETYTVFWTERDSPLEGMLGMVLDPNEAELADNADLRQFLDGVRQGKRPEGIDPEVEATNNGTERQIRHTVIDRRITQGTRGQAGMRLCERIWTTIATCKKQNRNVFDFIHQSIVAHWTHQCYPELL